MYYTVKDADEAASEAVKLGARVHVPLQDIPNVGRFCGITSPQGVVFYVIEYTRIFP
jgi:predicted enzyme related to lactoylglutathione lyase